VRFKYSGWTVDKYGNIVPNCDISIYLQGTDEPAKIYPSKDAIEPITTPPQVQSNNEGYFEFWVDDEDYSLDTLFKLEIKKGETMILVVENVQIMPPVEHNKLLNIQGGVENERFHLSQAELNDLTRMRSGEEVSDLHHHDNRYYTKTESDSKYAPMEHNHDDRYYTKTEIDNWNLIKNYTLEQNLNANNKAVVGADYFNSAYIHVWGKAISNVRQQALFDIYQRPEKFVIFHIEGENELKFGKLSDSTFIPLFGFDIVNEVLKAYKKLSITRIDNLENVYNDTLNFRDLAGNILMTVSKSKISINKPVEITGSIKQKNKQIRLGNIPLNTTDEDIYFIGNAGCRYVIPIDGGYLIHALMFDTHIVIIKGTDIIREEIIDPTRPLDIDLTAGSKIIANKPILVYRKEEMRPAINLRILGTRYVTWVDRYGIKPYIYSPFFDSYVKFYDSLGEFMKEYHIRKGELLVGDAVDLIDRAYFIESSAPVSVFKNDPNEINDTIHLIPIASEFIGKAGGNVWVVANYDDTVINYYASDGTTGQITLRRGESQKLSGASQYAGVAYRLEASKPFFVYNEADGDGVDQTPFLPIDLLSNYYSLPVEAEFIAFAGKEMFEVEIFLPDGTRHTFMANGHDENKCYEKRIHANDIGLDAIPAGTIVTTSRPTWAMFEELKSDNECIWFGVKTLP